MLPGAQSLGDQESSQADVSTGSQQHFLLSANWQILHALVLCDALNILLWYATQSNIQLTWLNITAE